MEGHVNPFLCIKIAKHLKSYNALNQTSAIDSVNEQPRNDQQRLTMTSHKALTLDYNTLPSYFMYRRKRQGSYQNTNITWYKLLSFPAGKKDVYSRYDLWIYTRYFWRICENIHVLLFIIAMVRWIFYIVNNIWCTFCGFLCNMLVYYCITAQCDIWYNVNSLKRSFL
jgi:hypothetical protein